MSISSASAFFSASLKRMAQTFSKSRSAAELFFGQALREDLDVGLGEPFVGVPRQFPVGGTHLSLQVLRLDLHQFPVSSLMMKTRSITRMMPFCTRSASSGMILAAELVPGKPDDQVVHGTHDSALLCHTTTLPYGGRDCNTQTVKKFFGQTPPDRSIERAFSLSAMRRSPSPDREARGGPLSRGTTPRGQVLAALPTATGRVTPVARR